MCAHPREWRRERTVSPTNEHAVGDERAGAPAALFLPIRHRDALREVDTLSVTYNAGLVTLGDYPQLARGRVVWITNNDQLARVQLPALTTRRSSSSTTGRSLPRIWRAWAACQGPRSASTEPPGPTSACGQTTASATRPTAFATPAAIRTAAPWRWRPTSGHPLRAPGSRGWSRTGSRPIPSMPSCPSPSRRAAAVSKFARRRRARVRRGERRAPFRLRREFRHSRCPPCGALGVEAGEPVGACEAARSCGCGIDDTSCIGQLWLSLPGAD
jgi:hypothetical protein